jgi:hypothetical protein
MTKGVSKLSVPVWPRPPAWLSAAGTNLARAAAVSVSGHYDPAKFPPANINDGNADILDNKARWLSDNRLPHRVELTWKTPQTIRAARIVTGHFAHYVTAPPADPITDFVLEYHDGSDFKNITRVTDNQTVDWHATFPPVKTDRIRLTVTATPGNVTRIWEIEFYNPPALD